MKRSIWVSVLMLLLPLALVLGIVRPFVAEVFRIPSESMSPTLRAGDRVLVGKFDLLFRAPHRGDLIAFRATQPVEGVYVKRLVGEAGDTVAIRDGVLYVNGRRHDEPYVNKRLTDSTFFGPEKVPAGHVFVLGDNRSNSLDSRANGPVAQEDVLGPVLLDF